MNFVNKNTFLSSVSIEELTLFKNNSTQEESHSCKEKNAVSNSFGECRSDLSYLKIKKISCCKDDEQKISNSVYDLIDNDGISRVFSISNFHNPLGMGRVGTNIISKKTPVPFSPSWYVSCDDKDSFTRIFVRIYFDQFINGPYSITTFRMEMLMNRRNLFGAWRPWREAKTKLKWKFKGVSTTGYAVDNNYSNLGSGTGVIDYNNAGSFMLVKNKGNLWKIWQPLDAGGTSVYGPKDFRAAVLLSNVTPSISSCSLTGEASGKVWFKKRKLTCTVTYP